MSDSPPTSDRLWLLTGDVPTGPYNVQQVHAELAAGRATWQSPACPVGGSTWLPLVRTPGFGPAADPVTASVQPAGALPQPLIPSPHTLPAAAQLPPRPAAPRPPGAAGPATHTVGVLLLVVGIGAALYGLYEWGRPLTPTEVCRRLDAASSPAEAKRYATPRMHPLLDAIHADPAALDPTDTFEWTQEVDGPRPRTRLVGFRGSWLSREAGRRVRVEGHVLAVQDGGWKADDMVFTAVEGEALAAPVSLVDEHRRNPTPPARGGAGASPPGAARPPVGFWAYVERNWKGAAVVAYVLLAGAWNALRPRPAARRAGPGGAG
ncbi:MAG TPA: hypothetical protein VH092_10280 [Urbifossiella sp.]|jgi:hypothetical protein|nr:hypothetical protein [Urbifossiella sp.]